MGRPAATPRSVPPSNPPARPRANLEGTLGLTDYQLGLFRQAEALRRELAKIKARTKAQDPGTGQSPVTPPKAMGAATRILARVRSGDS